MGKLILSIEIDNLIQLNKILNLNKVPKSLKLLISKIIKWYTLEVYLKIKIFQFREVVVNQKLEVVHTILKEKCY